MIDWDLYRLTYDMLSYEDQLKFYDEVWKQHPVQKHYDSATCKRFLEKVNPKAVVEIGGWRGELAAEMLPLFPDIMVWRNYEICKGAANDTVCLDSRYDAEVPLTWVWSMSLNQRRAIRGNTLVASHVLEHMNAEQVEALLKAIHPNAAFIAAPLTESGQDWNGYEGSHVLTWGWKDIINLFETQGLIHDSSFDTSEVRCFLSSQ